MSPADGPDSPEAILPLFDHLRSHACASYRSCFAVYPRDSRSRVFFVLFLFFFTLARRSCFFRRLARFLTLSLPLLCPINPIFARFLSESKATN